MKQSFCGVLVAFTKPVAKKPGLMYDFAFTNCELGAICLFLVALTP
jgi:hypothetical protein